MDNVKIFTGGIAVDDRGYLTFCNDFNFENVKRSYMVENFDKGFVRAWHGHKKEGKYVTVVSGSALIGLVDLRKLDDWSENTFNKMVSVYNHINDSTKKGFVEAGVTEEVWDNFFETPLHRIVVSSKLPKIVWIPPGFVNGAMTLEENTKLMYFSTTTLGESEGDDYRFVWNFWNPWGVEKR